MFFIVYLRLIKKEKTKLHLNKGMFLLENKEFAVLKLKYLFLEKISLFNRKFFSYEKNNPFYFR
jgi:hypothetical protein